MKIIQRCGSGWKCVFLVLVSHCQSNRLPQIQWLKTTFILQFWRSRVQYVSHWAKIKVSARLHLFQKLQGIICSLASFQRPPAFLGSWPFSPSSKSSSKTSLSDSNPSAQLICNLNPLCFVALHIYTFWRLGYGHIWSVCQMGHSAYLTF